MRKREILLVIVLVVFGVIYRAVEKGKMQFVNDFSFYSDERRLKGSKFSEFPDKEKIFAAVNAITMENPAGEITVNKSSDGQVHLLAFTRVYYTDKGIVDGIRKKVAIQSVLDNGELKISVPAAADFPYQNLRVLLHVLVPQGTALTISNQEGDTIIRDTGKDVEYRSGKWQPGPGKHSLGIEIAPEKLQCEYQIHRRRRGNILFPQ